MATKPATIGDMRRILEAGKANWTIDAIFKDDTALPKYSHGADLTKIPLAKNVPRIDISVELKKETSNPFLRQLRVGSGFLKPRPISAKVAAEQVTAGGAPAAGGASASVDWRNRWGWPWLTLPKDQGPCESCWVFSAVGAVEAMTRIEHCYWSLRSEGDVHDGLGVNCAQTGGPATALDWMKTNGVADPACRAYETTDHPVPPTPDRDGRTVKLADYVQLNNVEDQKLWIDQNGPISACFSCYYDWESFGFTHQTGVYICNPASGLAGGHCIVIVGYDDAKQAWLVRNSWGSGWGMAGSPGYIWMGYGQADIDAYTKYGVGGSAVNPDPWTKRRNHNGNFIESGDGQWNRNFEVWATAPGDAVRHYWRDGATLNWAVAETQGNDVGAMPTVTGTTYDRNFEMIYPTTSRRLHHRYFDQATGKWLDGPIFGPTNVNGVVGFIQGDFGAPGNFEVVAPLTDGTMVHWWRNEANNAWAQSVVFGKDVAMGGATLMERFDKGLDYICVNKDGTMQRYYRVLNGGWSAEEKFGSNVHSSPVMIRSEFSESNETAPGNYELCVAVNGQFQHWWTPGEAAAKWTMDASFGTNIKQVLGLIESSFGFDLELIALLNDGSIQHFWRDNTWHAGPIFGSSPVELIRPVIEHPVLA
jgi:Papain family cysteine protease